MLTVIKVLVVLTWLVMVLLLVFAPSKPRGGKAVVFHVSDWGPEVERDFLHTLKTLPPKSQLMIVDDGTDDLRSRVLERLIIRNPGVVAVKPQELNHPRYTPADCFSNGCG